MTSLIQALEHPKRLSNSERILVIFTIFARLAVATGFLSSVADRFGLWGPLGTPGVSWGSFEPFRLYTADVMPFLSDPLVSVAAWLSTIAETLLGFTLLLGIFTRLSAVASGLLLLSFAVLLGIFVDRVKPFSFSVFSASSAAFLLAVLPEKAYAWTLDKLLLQPRPLRKGKSYE
jgi:uncharacterized membrane protein YphA (DoxX/SURF4 family)